MGAMIEDWAIIGYETGRDPRYRVIRFAGGRSRRKLEWIAQRMNESGGYQVAIRWVRLVSKP